jgi:hypothetical protein
VEYKKKKNNQMDESFLLFQKEKGARKDDPSFPPSLPPVIGGGIKVHTKAIVREKRQGKPLYQLVLANEIKAVRGSMEV